MFPEEQAPWPDKFCRHSASLFTSCSRPRQYVAGSGPSTRPVFTDNTICDRPWHICREGRSIPVAMIYSKALMTDFAVFTGQHWYLFGFCYCRYIMPEFVGYYKPLFYIPVYSFNGRTFLPRLYRQAPFIYTYFLQLWSISDSQQDLHQNLSFRNGISEI